MKIITVVRIRAVDGAGRMEMTPLLAPRGNDAADRDAAKTMEKRDRADKG